MLKYFERLVKWSASGAAALLLLGAGSAYAALTPVNSPNGSEPNLINNSSQPSVMNYLYGAGNYTRIDDSVDQIWSVSSGNTFVVAKFAGNGEVLGYFPGASGPTNASTFQALYSVGGSGYAVSGSSSGLNQNTFRWGIQAGAAQGTQYFSSSPVDNLLDSSAFKDHMVTFKITGNAGHPNNAIGDFVIAFEDLIENSKKGLASDRDFNDAVFQVKPSNLAVPEPATYLLLGSALLLTLVAKRRSLGKA